MEKVIEITNNNFETEVSDSVLPVLVDVYADWCKPCKMLAPIVEELCEKFSNRLKICKADMETNDHLIREQSISAIPALLIFKDGKVIKKMIGLKSKGEIEKEIEACLC